MFERIGTGGSWGWLGNVYDAVNVEGNFFVGSTVGFIAKAVGVAAVEGGGKGVVARGSGVVLGEEGAGGVLDLRVGRLVDKSSVVFVYSLS
jgi:hypothetical protein